MAKHRKRRRPLRMDSAIVAGKRSVSSIVYAFRFPSRPGAIKVGHSKRGLERVREQTTGYPEAPEVLLVFHHRDAAHIERGIHQALAAHQIHDAVGTEWFRVGIEDVVEASPALRAALGRQRWRRSSRLVLFVFGLVALALFTPSWIALTKPVMGGMEAARQHAHAIAALSPSAWGHAFGEVGRLVWGEATLDERMPLAAVVGGWAWLVFWWR